MQQQRPSKLPLVIGAVLIVATIARHRRRAHDGWHAGAVTGAPGPRGHHDQGGFHDRYQRRGHLAAWMAACAERMAAERAVEYI